MLLQAARSAFLLILLMATSAGATTIDFDSLGVGEPVVNQFLAQGLAVGATHLDGGVDLAITFDSSGSGSADPDLEAPWRLGNLAPDTILNNVLILPENNSTGDGNGDGLVDNPDDEGARPAGVMHLLFSMPIISFGLDLIDIEPDVGELGALIFYRDGAEVGNIAFGSLVGLGGPIVFGDNSANRIAPVTAASLGTDFFDRVDVFMGGSGAIDTLQFSQVPEPGTLALLGGALGAVALGRRRSRPRR